MRLTVFLSAALALIACGKPEGPKTGKALYLEPGKLFSCRAPARWKVLENQGGAQRATFVGPPDGPAPFSEMIGVYFYSKSGSSFAAPKDYAKSEALLPGKTGPLVFKTWKGLAVYEFSATRPRPVLHGAGQSEIRRELDVLIPAPDGFFAFVYSAPEADSAGEATFRDLIDSVEFGAAR